jgi:choline dehydrogenase-like flavoprotein
MKFLKTEVCIVGSGIAGSLCAKYLAERFGDITIVERGARMSHSDRLKTKQQEVSISTAIHRDVVLGEVPEKKIQYVYAVGGTTNHWMGQTPRLLPNDFRMKTFYGVGDDWLISYDELEPFYCLAEEELSIAGGPDNPRIPRSKPYPLKPHPFSPGDEIFQRCFDRGAVVASPQARPPVPIGDRPACCGSGTCQLCPVDSKYTTLNTHIPQLEKMKNVRILSQRVVLHIESDGTRKGKRAFTLGNHGDEMVIESDHFILAAHALENAAILLRSQQVKKHPLLGKYLFDHPNFTVAVLLNQDAHPAYGHTVFTAHCYQFYDGDFRSNHSAALGEIYNLGHLPISYFVLEGILKKGLTGDSLRRYTQDKYRKQLTINFLLEDLPNPNRFLRVGQKSGELQIPNTEIFYTKHSNYVVNSRTKILKELPRFLAPLGIQEMIATDLEDHAGHLLGTCRMGSYENGVVDENLRYHELDNLYILGGSAFPTYSPSNPTLTIAALAIRLGKYF